LAWSLQEAEAVELVERGVMRTWKWSGGARSRKWERQHDHVVATIDETSGTITKREGRK